MTCDLLVYASSIRSFGDVHYFYGPPTASPPHHRFDKGSYVYLFENAEQRRARIEIANQPGTSDQDAFDGCKPAHLISYPRADASCLMPHALWES